ncbi:MAG: 4Fe-4S ferredoxin [Chloroflexi bacterium]|nr:4Fe-4S ferredoxin [Chloroflexota bacterium]
MIIIIVLVFVLILMPFALKAAHMYIYGRWTPQYVKVSRRVILPRIGTWGRQWWANRFHSKVLTPEQAKSLITIDCKIRRDLEQILPYPMARKLVLDGPPDVTLYECACRLSREDHCHPTQVCMAIGQPFADFVLKHHPDRSRRVSQEEALEILQAAHARGNVHAAWFKDLFQGRMYALCNCCKCCCFGIETMTTYGTPMVASSGYVAQVDEAACGACVTCEDICPFGSMTVNGSAVVDWAACMGCGVCVDHCPDDALSLVRDEKKGDPLDVTRLV